MLKRKKIELKNKNQRKIFLHILKIEKQENRIQGRNQLGRI
jgi:hypothetical protein